MGLTLNILYGAVNIPTGPDRFICRLHKGICSLIEVFDIEYDKTAHILADLMTYTASVLYVFLIIWSFANTYILIPYSRIAKYIIDALIFSITIRLGQTDNLIILHNLKKGNTKKAKKLLKKTHKLPANPSNSDFYRIMIQRWIDALSRLITVPVFYMFFGSVPLFLYKTTEIIDRTSDNRIAHILYKICSFIPEYITLVILRTAVFIFGHRIFPGRNAETIIKNYLGINTDEDVFLYREVVKTNKAVYFTVIVFILLTLTVYISFTKFLF